MTPAQTLLCLGSGQSAGSVIWPGRILTWGLWVCVCVWQTQSPGDSVRTATQEGTLRAATRVSLS